MNPAVLTTAPQPPGWSAAALAQQLIDGGPVPEGLSADQALATAWALKDACYAAWSSMPQRAGPAAKAVALLCSHASSRPGWPADPAREMAALAKWTEGIAFITTSRMGDASEVLDQASSLFSGLGQADRAAQAQVPRIMALTMAGLHDEAARCAENTQKEFLRLHNAHAAGKVTLNLGGLQLARDDHRQAAVHYRKASVLFARTGDTEHSVMADIGLAKALSAMGDMEEAVRIYARARMRSIAHDLPVLRALADEAAAMLDLARGRFHDALQGFERARRLYEQLAMPQNLACAEVQLGQAYLEMRLLPEAVALLERAESAMSSLGMRDEHAWTQLQLARALAMTGLQHKAEPLLRQAASTFSSQDNQLGLPSVRLALAELALAQKHARQAHDLAVQAAAAFQRCGQAESRVRADATAALALLQLDQPAQARHKLREALDGAREMQLVLVQVQCETGLGLAAVAMGQPEPARQHFEAAIALFDEQRRALPCDEMRSALLADHLKPYQELLRLALERDDGKGLEVLRRLDHLHARALSERLMLGGRPDGSDSNRDLRVRLNWLYRHLNGRGDTDHPSPALAAELRRTERELLERVRRERLLEGQTPLLQPASEFDPLQWVQRLGPTDALVAFGVLDDELFACVARSGGVKVVRRLAAWSDVVGSLRAARFQIDAMRYGTQALAPHLGLLQRRAQAHLQRLHGLVWAPVGEHLQAVDRVMVVPHGELGAVPFAAFHDGHRWLGERLDLAVAPSAHIALRMMSPPGEAPRSVLALGESRHLQHAADEARFVAAAFEQAHLAVDADATTESLRRHGAGSDVVHLACHAEFRHDNPMFSALHLADGPLTAELVESLRLPGALVVLSACETGLAGQSSGDELVGLVRAFLVSGASRVVASLWPVDDAVTMAFMGHFYRALRSGLPAAAALRRAQATVRSDHPHPFHWAPFVLHCGW